MGIEDSGATEWTHALVRAIAERTDRVSDSCLFQEFDEAKQEAFAVMAVSRMGFDFERGRLDRVTHPFETSFRRNDVRITTRYDPKFFSTGFFSIAHEAGHGMYEQGVAPSLDGTNLGHGASSMLHESQSRMWENVVGRGRGFWQHFYPKLQETFPSQFGGVPLDTFYGAINKVEPSLIRIEADEVTYNMHIMLRFEMELELLTGNLAVKDAPEAWKTKMEEYLGVWPPDDKEGILQDIHWSGVSFGGFPSYTLGNVIGAQLIGTVREAIPDLDDQVAAGEFEQLGYGALWFGESTCL